MKRASGRKTPKKANAGRVRLPRSRAHPKASRQHRWTFLSNHAHVLICLARDPDLRMRELAELIGITERAVMNIVSDLEAEGIVERHREGRRNSYELHLDQPLRHPVEKHRTVSELVRLILD